MILRCLARRPQALRLGASTARLRPTPARSLYTVPVLGRQIDLQQHGVPGLFTPEGFKIAYTDYQTHITRELNSLTAGTPLENQQVKALVVEFARDPSKAYHFNVASMAFNNHFFFRGLNTLPDVDSQPSSELASQINHDFSSHDTLRETFLATAEAMFGPGFVWLVQTTQGNLRILPTYLAGSPLSHAHYRRQSHDLNTENAESYQKLNTVGAFGNAAKQSNEPKKPLGGTDVVPLLCVDTWEHVWLPGYGITGKRRFLEAWWDKIDWEVARQHATHLRHRPEPNKFQS